MVVRDIRICFDGTVTETLLCHLALKRVLQLNNSDVGIIVHEKGRYARQRILCMVRECLKRYGGFRKALTRYSLTAPVWVEPGDAGVCFLSEGAGWESSAAIGPVNFEGRRIVKADMLGLAANHIRKSGRIAYLSWEL